MSILPMQVDYSFRQKPKARSEQPATRIIPRPSQTRNDWDNAGTVSFDSYEPLTGNYDFYDMLRRGIPLIEACYTKYKMLIGMPEFDFFGNRKAADMAIEFVENVKVNQFGSGFHECIIQLVDAALHYGNGYMEVIPNLGLNDIAMLKNAPSKWIKFMKDKDGNIVLGQKSDLGYQALKFEDQDLIHHLAFWKREGNPSGYSLLANLSFTSQLYYRIQNSIKNTFWRMGDPTFAFIVEIDKDNRDYEDARSTANAMVTSWDIVQESRMRGKPADFAMAAPPGATVKIQTVGNDIKLPDIEISLRAVIEQIVSQTGFPLFFFGMQWGGNYNMTTHQNDMIVNQINFFRRCIDPIVRKVMDQFFAFHNLFDVEFDTVWSDVNLRDEVEQAKAESERARALMSNVTAYTKLLDYGLSQDAFIRWLIEEGIEDEKNIKLYGLEKTVAKYTRRLEMARAAGLVKEMEYGFDRLN